MIEAWGVYIKLTNLSVQRLEVCSLVLHDATLREACYRNRGFIVTADRLYDAYVPFANMMVEAFPDGCSLEV